MKMEEQMTQIDIIQAIAEKRNAMTPDELKKYDDERRAARADAVVGDKWRDVGRQGRAGWHHRGIVTTDTPDDPIAMLPGRVVSAVGNGKGGITNMSTKSNILVIDRVDTTANDQKEPRVRSLSSKPPKASTGVTNKTAVANLVLKLGLTTDSINTDKSVRKELVKAIMEALNVTKANAGVYVYNYCVADELRIIRSIGVPLAEGV